MTSLRPGPALAIGPRDVKEGVREIWERAQAMAGRTGESSLAVRESAMALLVPRELM